MTACAYMPCVCSYISILSTVSAAESDIWHGALLMHACTSQMHIHSALPEISPLMTHMCGFPGFHTDVLCQICGAEGCPGMCV